MILFGVDGELKMALAKLKSACREPNTSKLLLATKQAQHTHTKKSISHAHQLSHPLYKTQFVFFLSPLSGLLQNASHFIRELRFYWALATQYAQAHTDCIVQHTMFVCQTKSFHLYIRAKSKQQILSVFPAFPILCYFCSFSLWALCVWLIWPMHRLSVAARFLLHFPPLLLHCAALFHRLNEQLFCLRIYNNKKKNKNKKNTSKNEYNFIHGDFHAFPTVIEFSSLTFLCTNAEHMCGNAFDLECCCCCDWWCRSSKQKNRESDGKKSGKKFSKEKWFKMYSIEKWTSWYFKPGSFQEFFNFCSVSAATPTRIFFTIFFLTNTDNRVTAIWLVRHVAQFIDTPFFYTCRNGHWPLATLPFI